MGWRRIAKRRRAGKELVSASSTSTCLSSFASAPASTVFVLSLSLLVAGGWDPAAAAAEMASVSSSSVSAEGDGDTLRPPAELTGTASGSGSGSRSFEGVGVGVGLEEQCPATGSEAREDTATVPPPSPSSSFYPAGLLSRATDIRGGGGTGALEPPLHASHFLVRIVFLRSLSFVYFVAFLVAYRQNKALIGDRGITPCRRYLWDAELRGRKKAKERREWIRQRKKFRDPGRGMGLWGKVRYSRVGRTVVDAIEENERLDKVREVLWDRSDRMDRPVVTLLWLAGDRRRLDPWLDGVAVVGMAGAALVFVLGAANVPLLFVLWLCQRSLLAVGGLWYAYGWEPQLAELGFHALFAVPVVSLNPVPPAVPVPLATVCALRWYLFRIMMGAGLIKVKSRDPKWKFPQLNAMHVFYETQPVPNPLSRYFHAMPGWWHKLEVLVNHFVELIAPWLLVVPGLPRRWRLMGGLIQLGFQAALILSGNLSFLNWLTAVPAIFCLDDAFVSCLFGPRLAARAASAAYYSPDNPPSHLMTYFGHTPLRRAFTSAFVVLIGTLSVPVVQNLLARKQRMNATYGRLRLVGSYGAFGTVNDHRDELIVESARHIEGPWREYRFKVKPGDVYRRPRWISPYHHRLDWQIWIAACKGGSVVRSPWLLALMLKLLRRDEGVLGLMEGGDPWADDNDSAGAPSSEGERAEEKEGNDDDQGNSAAGNENDAESTDGGGEEEEEAGDNGETKTGGERSGGPRFIRIVKYRYKFNYDREGEDGGGSSMQPLLSSSKSCARPYWKRERIGKFFPLKGTALTEDMLSEYIS